MTTEDVLWHLDCEAGRLEAVPPSTRQERLELRRIIARLQDILIDELEDLDADAA